MGIERFVNISERIAEDKTRRIKMKKRVLVCAVASVIAATCLAACGKDSDDGDEVILPETPITQKVDIEFWGWGDLAEQSNYQTLVNQFMAEEGNENINVIYVGNTATVHMQNLESRIRNLPQLFMLPDYDFYGWVADDTLKDITPYVTEAELSAIWPQAVDEYYYNPDTALLGKSEGAKLYGLPKDLGPFTLVYNKTLLDAQIEKNGLNKQQIYSDLLDPKDPMSWDEFRNLLKSLVPGLASGQYGISHYEIEAAIYSNNANFFNDDASQQRITEKNFADALQFCADLALKDSVMTPESQQDVDGFTRFQGGNCIFSFMGPWDCSQFWSFNIPFATNILPVPYGPGADGEFGTADDGMSTAWVGSMGYCVSKKASAVQTQAALRLAKYLSMNEKAQRKFYELGQQVPNIMEMAKDEYLNDTQGLLAGKDPADRSVWLDTIDGFSETDKVGGKVRPRYYTYSSGWYTDFTDYLAEQGLWKGTKTAAQICESYKDIFQKKLKDMRNELGIG